MNPVLFLKKESQLIEYKQKLENKYQELKKARHVSFV